jgi:endogenous inhibitor of DNA gyrase (YacG/DUF329 family)
MSRPPRPPCPTCGRTIDRAESLTSRPFCSERCRLIDLGAWLAERHAIPGEPLATATPREPGADEQRG